MSGYITDQQNSTGSFVASTSVWDVTQIGSTDVKSPEFKELLVRLYQNVNNIVIALNMKETGMYLQEEFATSAVFFDPTTMNSQLNLRAEFRKLINIGALGAGVTTVAHGLTIGSTWIFTDIYGAASLFDPVPANSNYYPLPWSSAAGATNIELKVNGTNVVITNNSGISFTSCYVILEYVKQ
jgi:hypothetical protein